jgi:hypothetical protein
MRELPPHPNRGPTALSRLTPDAAAAHNNDAF